MPLKQMHFLKYNILKILKSACICLFLLCALIQTAEPQDLEEYKIKAAFVYNFTKLIEWPKAAFNSEGKNFNIAVLGDEHIKECFQTIDGKIIGKRIISIQHFDPAAQDYKEAHQKAIAESQIVFISKDTRLEQVLQILDNIGDSPVLTIGEDKNFSRAGGIIQFFTRDDHLHFEVNIKNAETHQLKFSSRLLKLAVIVNET